MASRATQQLNLSMAFATSIALLIASIGLASVQEGLALDNGVGRRPTLGWNSWNRFGSRLDERVVRDTADALVASGLAAKGYRSLNLDDTWAAPKRSDNGTLIPDPTKFTAPMAELIADVHAKGLQFGIYTDVGFKTCAKRPGSYGHEVQDARTFAAWRVDFVKSDSCFTAADPSVQPADGVRCFADYKRMAAALNATGRPIVHSIKGPCGENPAVPCSPADASGVAHLRRAAGDVRDNWAAIVRVLDAAADVVNVSRPGFFADLDILEIGNGGLTLPEERAVFSLWCAVKSPLLLGNDLSAMTQATLDTVGNEELLAVNQDTLGLAARRIVAGPGGLQVWSGPLGEAGPRGGSWSPPSDGATADVHAVRQTVDEHVVVAFNTGNATESMLISWAAAGVCRAGSSSCTWDVRNLWTRNVSIGVAGGITVSVNPHAAVALRLENGTHLQHHGRASSASPSVGPASLQPSD